QLSSSAVASLSSSSTGHGVSSRMPRSPASSARLAASSVVSSKSSSESGTSRSGLRPEVSLGALGDFGFFLPGVMFSLSSTSKSNRSLLLVLTLGVVAADRLVGVAGELPRLASYVSSTI
ncbi:hypothetical protein Micbo1qcDRAFT_156245, partial [Microdochium bolleyi]